MKYLFLIVLTTLNACKVKTYEATVLKRASGLIIETRVNQRHYVNASINHEQADTLKPGDKVVINAATLRVIK